MRLLGLLTLRPPFGRAGREARVFVANFGETEYPNPPFVATAYPASGATATAYPPFEPAVTRYPER